MLLGLAYARYNLYVPLVLLRRFYIYISYKFVPLC